MRVLLLLLSLTASGMVASGAAAQPATVKGTVRDSTGAPLPGANVYLSGTQRGDATDARGRFEIRGVAPGAYRVVASMVGYAPEAEALTLASGDTARVDLVLRDAPVLGPAAQVEGERDRRWERRLEWFSRELIGESALADSTRILNPEVLDFRVRWGELTATARAPLVIENRGLGYRLHYDLAHFSASATRVSYDGDERFEPLAPEAPAVAARWAAAREAAYRGSLQHILQSLLAGDAEGEGFTLLLVYEADRTMRGSGATFRTSSRRVMRVD
ncbi:MAG: carboxypeptidase-like regulatory domain-containing protein, partial [Bacteroidota bacterium]